MSLLFLILLSLLFASGVSSLPVTTIGVTYNPSRVAHHPPSPDHVASRIQSSLKLFSAVRLPDPDPATIRAFAYSNISLLLNVPNSLLPALAANASAAKLWLYTHVLPFYPRARISTISVGSDALLDPDVADPDLRLLPALRNLHRSLRDLGIHSIAVSTTFSFVHVITTAFPPSAAEFQQPLADLLVKPLLQFLDQTNSSFLINLHPYSVYSLNHDIPIGYALFQEEPFSFRDDPLTGVRYRNLFDTMVDAVISAMAVAGHENIPVIVTETGWPSDDDSNYSEMYIKGLIRHLRSGLGTPLRKEGVAETYIYQLLDAPDDKNQSQRQNWGILYPNMTNKYHIDFSASNSIIAGGGGGRLIWVFVAVWLLH
ncbi:glucan endo-1,3-beta-glucosidase 12 [Diospyros lotus]|uniref:glucan endo-1,3-beta-glucosidase 12 n=1 Tax=Diospyros lotus TaxID=55363 RepID=UPI0022538E46|nr:glucan endo-1,3-beta-glucosidase 12 [Diospyros lotus]